jgi:hypothetical protein
MGEAISQIGREGIFRLGSQIPHLVHDSLKIVDLSPVRTAPEEGGCCFHRPDFLSDRGRNLYACVMPASGRAAPAR